ncbi:MAG: PIN domain-containing protein [Bacillota bacterium]
MKQTILADTNILIRLFTQDDDKQVEEILSIIEQGATLFILSIVLIEAYWILSKSYNYEKKDIINVFQELIDSDDVELEEEIIMQRTLNTFQTVNADFVDVYLAEKSKELKLPVLTWNHKDFKKLNCEYHRPQDLMS